MHWGSKRLSKQAWGIVPKIAQVDSFLLSGGLRDRSKLREVHPEVLFWALNDCSPMQFRKSTADGIEERLRVLERFVPRTRHWYGEVLSAWPRSQVARDDVVDALAAAVTGGLGAADLKTLPRNPENDEQGLPMEMVYWLPATGVPGNKT